METEILEELKIELGNEADFSEYVLSVKIKNAIREVKAARKYPANYTSTMIEADMERFYATIRNVALYDYNMRGAEGEAGHTENGITRTYTDRNKLFYDVIPLCKM